MTILKTISNRIDTLSDEKQHLLGLSLVLLASLCFSVSNTLVKHLTALYSSFIVVFWRGWVGIVILLLVTRFKVRLLCGVNRKILFLRGVIGTIALTCFFSSIKYTTLSNAIGIFNTFPTMATLVGILFFKEKWRKIYILALIFSLMGVWYIARPEIGVIRSGDMLALCGAFCAAWVINLVRYLRKTDSVFSIVFYLLIIATIVSFVPAGVHEIMRSFQNWGGLMLVAIFTTSAQILMTAGYTYCTATCGSIVSLMTLPLTLLFSILFIKESFTVQLGIGAALIFFSGYLVTMNPAD
ncbi:MAG: DMT family transporter [bacterium]